MNRLNKCWLHPAVFGNRPINSYEKICQGDPVLCRNLESVNSRRVLCRHLESVNNRRVLSPHLESVNSRRLLLLQPQFMLFDPFSETRNSANLSICAIMNSTIVLKKVVPNAKKFRYCGIDPELEDKLDLMFLGVVATGDHAWTPNQGLHHEYVTEDSEHIDIGSVSFEDLSQNLESINDCSQLKHPSSTTSIGRRKKIFASIFLRSQITQHVNSCTNITSETNATKSKHEKSSISVAIKVLEQMAELFEDMQPYLFSTKLLEDPTKRAIFMSIFPERRALYLRYCYGNHDTAS
ncbi:hypothetical protein KFK09_008579 [Dendrobium nobile]|uniref:Uncharacterized protein n=1 Tax=Dendrobium nobile TaxID=94219 RepID=A0A8T3BN45_DENNO|nr:hypothetical protein KFK09_008579 [Dendrobium nobile]